MKNILLVLISFVIIGCSTAVSPITNTVDLTNTDFINAKDFKEAKACEFFILGIGPFGNKQIIKAIQENYIKKVYAVDKYFSNWILFQRRCVLVYGEEMTRPEKIERRIKDEKIKEKKDAFWDKKKKKKDAEFWQYDFWF